MGSSAMRHSGQINVRDAIYTAASSSQKHKWPHGTHARTASLSMQMTHSEVPISARDLLAVASAVIPPLPAYLPLVPSTKGPKIVAMLWASSVDGVLSRSENSFARSRIAFNNMDM